MAEREADRALYEEELRADHEARAALEQAEMYTGDFTAQRSSEASSIDLHGRAAVPSATNGVTTIQAMATMGMMGKNAGRIKTVIRTNAAKTVRRNPLFVRRAARKAATVAVKKVAAIPSEQM